MKKKERLFILAILALALILWLGMRLLRPDHYGTVTISVSGQLYGTYSLGDDQTIAIGDTNICEIKDGAVHMTEASCPDHLCIRQGSIDSSGGMIVCLPNQVVIEAGNSDTSEDNSGLDAIAQ